MDETVALIERLSREAKPVRHIPSLPFRLARWTALSALLIAGVSLFHGWRPDLAQVATEPGWLLQQGLTLATALAAAVSAQAFGVPGKGRGQWWLWLGTLCAWLLMLRLEMGSAARPLAEGWELFCPYCFPLISIGGALALYADIRRTAPLAPLRTMLTLCFAGAALGIFGERLIHDDMDAPLLLMMQALAILGAGAVLAPLGRALFRWRHSRHRR